MKIVVDLPDDQLAAIDRLAAEQQRSRDAVIQDAIATYLAEKNRRARDAAFGLWGDLKIDSLEYQRKLRDEW
jgi:metal-responsive CopG/Arc/MetJ family transcriptional regulator